MHRFLLPFLLLLALLLLPPLSTPLLAQFDGTTVNVTEAPPQIAREHRYARDGSGNVEYIGIAQAANETNVFAVTAANSRQPRTTIAVVSLTDITVAATTATATTTGAHGLAVGQRVVVRGATGDTDLNGTYTIATVPLSTTFTFTVANVTGATYNEATLKIETNAPRTNSAVWSIRRIFYTGSDPDRQAWAHGSSLANYAWDSRTTYWQ